MNGPDFFMRHVGYRLLPTDQQTQDAVTDADTLLRLSLTIQKSKKQRRIQTCWMVVTPQWVATNFKFLPALGFRQDMERKTAIKEALQSGDPCILLALGKRNMTARDLFVTYDPRAARLCSEGKVHTYDATQEKTWTS